MIEYLFERGYKNIFIIEGSWIGGDTMKTYGICGYADLSRKYGIALIDVKKDEYEAREFGGFKTEISKRGAGSATCLSICRSSRGIARRALPARSRT